MFVVADTPTMGLLIGVPATLLILAACAVAFVIGRRMERTADRYSQGDGRILSWFAAGVAVIVVVIATFSFWPFEHNYHFWVPVTGRVDAINKRIVSDGDGNISQRFVVAVRGRQYGVDDTRATLLKVGDNVRLRCKKEHQFMQPHESDGWACRWGGVS